VLVFVFEKSLKIWLKLLPIFCVLCVEVDVVSILLKKFCKLSTLAVVGLSKNTLVPVSKREEMEEILLVEVKLLVEILYVFVDVEVV